jgi:hypothetical protein
MSGFALDRIGTASAAAFGTRRLRADYLGAALRVRRSTDNAEADIGFNSVGGLDTVALLAHVGGGSGFLATWYEQSGNGRHATQTTAASQPRIVNAGVVDTLNGDPSLFFSGAQALVCGGTRFGDTINFSAVSTIRRDDATATQRSAWGNRTTAGRILRTTLTTILYAHINAGSPTAIASANATAVVHSAVVESGVTTRHRVNGAGEQSVAASYVAANANMQIGTQATGGEFFIGSIPEIIFFDAAISDADRLSLERNQGAAFGITVA